jgi:excisionase family DNA binding protein
VVRVGDGSPDEQLPTSAEIAKRLAVTPRSVTMWVQQGKLVPAIVTPGGRYRFRWSEVEAQLRAARESDDW